MTEETLQAEIAELKRQNEALEKKVTDLRDMTALAINPEDDPWGDEPWGIELDPDQTPCE